MSLIQAIANTEIAKRERARLKEMQRLKKQKIQEILDTQNAAIDADMVCIQIHFFARPIFFRMTVLVTKITLNFVEQ